MKYAGAEVAILSIAEVLVLIKVARAILVLGNVIKIIVSGLDI